MTVALGVDTRHLAAEEPAVGGGVPELVDGDIIVDHLMEDSIFDEGFGQVDTGIDTEDEVFVTGGSKEPGAMPGEGQFAKESAGMGELDGNRRQRIAEEAGVKLVKAGLDVGNRWDHANVRRTNV